MYLLASEWNGKLVSWSLPCDDNHGIGIQMALEVSETFGWQVSALGKRIFNANTMNWVW